MRIVTPYEPTVIPSSVAIYGCIISTFSVGVASSVMVTVGVVSAKIRAVGANTNSSRLVAMDLNACAQIVQVGIRGASLALAMGLLVGVPSFPLPDRSDIIWEVVRAVPSGCPRAWKSEPDHHPTSLPIGPR